MVLSPKTSRNDFCNYAFEMHDCKCPLPLTNAIRLFIIKVAARDSTNAYGNLNENDQLYQMVR